MGALDGQKSYAGSVRTPLGPCKGIVLVDPDTGLPIGSAGAPFHVDTELTLDAGDIYVDNLRTGSTDGAALDAGVRVDADWHAQVDVLTLPTINLPTSAGNEITDVPSVGATDRVQLGSHPCLRVSIQSHTSNTGKIYVGGAAVTNSTGVNEGIDIDPGDVFGPIEIDNTNKLYVAAAIAGDDVKVIWLT